MNSDDQAILQAYLEEKFGRVHDRLEGIHREVSDFNTRVTRVEESVDGINGRMWTIGALTGAVGTGLGALVAWLTLNLQLGSWIKVIK